MSTKTETTPKNYLQRIFDAAEHLPEGGKLAEVLVSHDDTCAIFDGKPCDCTPDIEFTLEDGSVTTLD